MARRVFFSFHYQRDVMRVEQVRNCDVVKTGLETTKFLDKAERESIWRKGDAAIKRWINSQLNGTSVTVVLIGYGTHTRPYVLYEIEKSLKEKKGLLGIRIHGIKAPQKGTDLQGKNPFEYYEVNDERAFKKHGGSLLNRAFPSSGYKPLTSVVKTYDWVNDDGRTNIQKWIEAAAKEVGR